MGLDAFVRCRCWQDGLAKQPPVPAAWIEYKDNEFDLVAPHDTMENHLAVDRWMHDACPHENMEAADERLANWTGYRLFQNALASVGWHSFPALKANLPNANGGQMPARASAKVLDELAYFGSLASVGTETYLADEETGASTLVYVPAYDGEVFLGPGYRAGMTPDGFFFRRGDEGIVFQAARFEQVVDERGVRFLADGQVLEVPFRPLGDPPARRLHVAERVLTPAEFDYIVQPLLVLCRASVATGNPVAWC